MPHHFDRRPAQKVFNSFVENFVENTIQERLAHDKHGAWYGLHQDEAFFTKFVRETKWCR
jgi:hypothetical protein